jgi:hypothetical protein
MKEQWPPAAWEQQVARNYGMDLPRDREFLDEVRDSLKNAPFESFEDYDAYVENLWRFYILGREPAEGSEDGTSAGDDPRGNSRRRVDVEIELDDETEARITALSEYLAKIAALDPCVTRFRAQTFGGLMKTVSPEEALEFLEAHCVLGCGNVKGPIRSLWWPDSIDYLRRFRVLEDSVLGELQRLVTHLKLRFPWTDDSAAYFVLCGGVPRAAPMRAKYTTHLGDGVGAHRYNRPTTITLEVASWAPSELVSKVYSQLQRKFHGGHTPRGPGRRNMDVFRFVVNQSEVRIVNSEEYLARLKLPPWRRMLENWNRQFSEGDPQRYPDVRNFQRDFRRGQKGVIGTKWGLPGVPGQPMTAEDRKTARRNAQRILERLGQPKRRKKRREAEGRRR